VARHKILEEARVQTKITDFRKDSACLEMNVQQSVFVKGGERITLKTLFDKTPKNYDYFQSESVVQI
jgi:hypothetical protein